MFIPTGEEGSGKKVIYLNNNGTHVDIVVPTDDSYIIYGWGSKVFFMEVPEWRDLTVLNAMHALFLKPAAAIRVIKTKEKHPYWVPVKLNDYQFDVIKKEIARSFRLSEGHKIWIKSTLDANYFEAKGSYNAVHTCNSWVIGILKKAGLRAPLYGVTSNSIMRYYEG